MARSHVKKRRRGCLGGCLTKIILLLGLCALLFVGACVSGVVSIDQETGAPQVSFEDVKLPSALENMTLPELDLSALSAKGFSLPGWEYSLTPSGLTVKTLRAGGGEAVLVCCDGYTMLLGAGENGLLTAGQMLLCGVKNLSVAAMLSVESGQMGGMNAVLALGKPAYFLYPDTQTKTSAYNVLLERAQQGGAQLISPEQGLTFSLGRATVRVIGPKYKHHKDERDDGLSIRIDYGQTSVLVMGTITQAAERELISSGAPLDADVLICARGGAEEATSLQLVEAVTPQIALMTGKEPANSIKVRLERTGCKVYTVKENGVMTLVSDGQDITLHP